MKIPGFRSRKEDAKRFYLWWAVVSIFVWVLAGLVSFIELTSTAAFVVEMFVGLAPCAIFLFSVLTWLEIKRKTSSTEKAQKIEDGTMVLFALLTVFAQIIFQTIGGISFGLPMTIASLCLVGIVRMIPLKEERKSTFINRRFTTKQIITILLLGSFASVIFANFISITAKFMEHFAG